jgi:type II secretory pathway pseudopilin PulG
MQLIPMAPERVRARLAGQDGFTMITVMLVLFIVGILSVAAIAAANGDIHLSRYDEDQKEAYAAAEAGINDYFAHLQQDSDYWTRCAGEDATKPLGAGNAVNQPQDRGLTGLPARKWRAVPNANSRYSIELIPGQAGAGKKCDTTDPVGSMVDNEGNIRIRATGNVNGTTTTQKIVATFRRRGFLDYIYFTDLENQDPTYLTLALDSAPTRSTDSSGTPDGGSDLYTWAADKCEHHWWGTQASGEGRAAMPNWHGQYLVNGTWTPSTGTDTNTSQICGEITFAGDDKVNGPFHSNDDILVSGTPDFGRTTNNDIVEVANISSSDQGWRGGGASPIFHTPSGKLTTQADSLDLPPTNTAIKAQAQSAYLYTGPTTIRLNGTTMDVTTNGSTSTGVPLPSNGVIYVQNSACTYGFKPADTESVDAGCGTTHVSGTYSKDLTIASADDVIVDGNVTRTAGADAVLGLVADKFVRVWHPADRSQSGCPNKTTPTNVQIDAAILALNHSFTVDNYDCGAPLGTLTVNGVIAQKHRGIVGVGGSSISHGYIKNYTYDDRLKYRSPPYFLDPVQASWRILRQNDQ